MAVESARNAYPKLSESTLPDLMGDQITTVTITVERYPSGQVIYARASVIVL